MEKLDISAVVTAIDGVTLSLSLSLCPDPDDEGQSCLLEDEVEAVEPVDRERNKRPSRVFS